MGKVGGTAVICAGVSYIFSVKLFRGFYLLSDCFTRRDLYYF
jgi:hypothetical protein